MKTCISPAEIEAWELEAYLYGDAPVKVVEHIARCPGCSARVNELRDLHRRLQRALARADCPTTETLRQRRWNQLPQAQARSVDAHLAFCAACQAEYASLVGPEPGAAQQALAMVQQLLTAVFQPPLAPVPVLRGAETPPAVYRVPEKDWEIVLTPATGARGYVLTGQLLGIEPEELAAAQAGILADDRLVLKTDVDPTGWFVLQPLSAGQYTLWIEVGTIHIRVPEVIVGPD
jgi:anti-sigma factor RsiW